MKLIDDFFNKLFPKGNKCIFCEKDLKSVNVFETCNSCQTRLPRTGYCHCKACGIPADNTDELCSSCKKCMPTYQKAISEFNYLPPITSLIARFKYGGEKHLAKPLAHYLAQAYSDFGLKADVLVPIPIHSQRLKQRGYNQSVLLAEELSKIINIPLNISALTREKNTKSQVDLTYNARFLNLENAFKYDNSLKGKTILLIDDVFTTGATCESCAKTINDAKVIVLTLARTVYKKD